MMFSWYYKSKKCAKKIFPISLLYHKQPELLIRCWLYCWFMSMYAKLMLHTLKRQKKGNILRLDGLLVLLTPETQVSTWKIFTHSSFIFKYIIDYCFGWVWALKAIWLGLEKDDGLGSNQTIGNMLPIEILCLMTGSWPRRNTWLFTDYLSFSQGTGLEIQHKMISNLLMSFLIFIWYF